MLALSLQSHRGCCSAPPQLRTLWRHELQADAHACCMPLIGGISSYPECTKINCGPRGETRLSGLELSAPKSRDSLRLRRRFFPLPRKSRDFLRPQGARFPLRRKSLVNRDFFCESWVKMALAAEFPAIPSSAAKIASERRCAILVHSGRGFGALVA